MARQALMSEGSYSGRLKDEQETTEKLKQQLQEDAKKHDLELKEALKKADDLAAQLRRLESDYSGAASAAIGSKAGTVSGNSGYFWRGLAVGALCFGLPASLVILYLRAQNRRLSIGTP
jgi:hypothetical protein